MYGDGARVELRIADPGDVDIDDDNDDDDGDVKCVGESLGSYGRSAGDVANWLKGTSSSEPSA